MINTSNFNKPFSPSPWPPLVSITRVDKGPTAPHGDTKGRVTGTSPCRLTKITLLPEELLQALLALPSSNSVPLEGEGTWRHLLTSMPSKAITTRTGKGVNLNQKQQKLWDFSPPNSKSERKASAGWRASFLPEESSLLCLELLSFSIKAWTVLVVCGLFGELSVTCRFGLGTVRLLSAGLGTLPLQVLHHLQQGRALQLQG